jgi:NAD(P)-dependent dehydrogenase (short-subunit alcohol dehydrogenase family)
MLSAAAERFGGIDVLYRNAGRPSALNLGPRSADVRDTCLSCGE